MCRSFMWKYSKGWDCWVTRYIHYLSLCDNVKLSYKASGQIFSSIYGIEVCVCVKKMCISPLIYSFPILDIVRQCSECTVHFSRSVMSNSLQPNGLQHSRLPCPSPSPKICPSSCPFHQWCHSVISSSDALFSALNLSQHQGLFQWVRFFTSDKQNTGASASVSVLPRNIEDWFPSRLTGLIFFGEGKVHCLKCLWLFST